MGTMMCQKCSKREATRHEAERAEDGTWTEVHVCDPCAEKGEMTPLSQASFVQALIQSAAQLGAPKAPGTARECPKCGITYAEFRTRGRLGCPHDYEVFLAELLPLLERIHHGGLQHLGKSPASMDGRSESERELIELRRALSESIQREQYEEAARLRDRIRKVEEAPAAGGAPGTELSVPPAPTTPPAPPAPPRREPKPGNPPEEKKKGRGKK
jgi:protein arginine kinase activator